MKSPIWKQINDSYGYCAKPNFFSTAHHTLILLLRISKLFVCCKSTNNFTTGNRRNIWLLCIEKLFSTFKSPIWKYFDDLYGHCGKPNFLATAHYRIIFLLRIPQLFVCCKSTYYFITGNRLNICLLCIEICYVKFKPPIWKYFIDLCG